MDTSLIVAAGSIAVGIGALLKGRGRKLEAEAEGESANAKAVVELVVQLGALRTELARVQAEVTQLRLEVDAGELALAAERDRANRAELAAQEATAWAKSLAEEMAELRKAILGGHTLPSNLPPAR